MNPLFIEGVRSFMAGIPSILLIAFICFVLGIIIKLIEIRKNEN